MRLWIRFVKGLCGSVKGLCGSLFVMLLLSPLLLVNRTDAAGSSGFPSRPRFQSVGIGATAPANGGLTVTPASGTAVTINSVAANVPLLMTDGTRTGRVDFSGGTFRFGPTSNSVFEITGANGTVRASIDAGMKLGSPTGGDKGAGTLNAAGLIYVNNVPVSTVKSVGFTASNNLSTAPSAFTQVFASSGMTAAANAAACSSAICQYDLTGFTGAGTYICTANTANASFAVRRATYSAGSVTIQTFNTTTGAAAAATVDVVCTGT
jgi:hypothetical protein